MKNFARALALALPYRVNVLLIVATSSLMAVMWGANIGVAYPFVEVVFQGQSLQEWVNREIATNERKIGEFRETLRERREALRLAEGAPTTKLRRQVDYLESRLTAEELALVRSRWLKPLIDNYLPTAPFTTLCLIVLTLLVFTTIKDTMLVANMLLVERLVQLVIFDVRKQLFRQTLRLDLASLGQSREGETLSRFTHDIGYLSTGLSTLFGRSITEPLKMLACMVGAACICWRLLLFSLLIAPPALLVMRFLAQSIKRANRRALEEMSQLYNVLGESLRGIQTVKAYTMEQFERHRFHQSAKKVLLKALRIVFYNSLTKPVTEIMGIGVISLALVAGAYLVLNQETHLLGIQMSPRPLSLASLLVFFGLLAGISDPARKLSETFGYLQGGVAAADRIFPLLDRETTITEPAEPRPLVSPHHRIVFDNVHFHYQASNPVLRGISLEIKFGETIAVVGPNGCGKTTLVNLLERFYDPIEGAIRWNDVDLRDARLRDVRDRIGLVTQQAHLFDDTILENIRYGSPQAKDEEVIAAAKQAQAHAFITTKMEQGYETRVGPSGNRLSGGQRQRIALARAILRDPELLILDEATSQIDIESEQLIHRVLEEFTRGRTSIMITHRFSTLALADRILVMDAGRIVDLGTHEELTSRCDLYRRLYEIQFRQSA